MTYAIEILLAMIIGALVFSLGLILWLMGQNRERMREIDELADLIDRWPG